MRYYYCIFDEWRIVILASSKELATERLVRYIQKDYPYSKSIIMANCDVVLADDFIDDEGRSIEDRLKKLEKNFEFLMSRI